jgi:hypothetical protein
MSRWPDDPTRFRPSPGWLGVIVVSVMLGIFAVIGGFMWSAAHHNTLAAQLTGDWSSPGSRTELSILAETRTYQYSAGYSVTRETGDLLVKGSIDGRAVSGRIVVPGFPPWGSTVQTTLRGRRWTLRSEGSGLSLSLVSESGQVTTLSAAQRALPSYP